MKQIISITWGKSCNYIPCSTEPICWDGTLSVSDGTLLEAEKLTYGYVQWCQAVEESHPLAVEGNVVDWKASVEPGHPLSLEGLRVSVEGADHSVITLDFGHTKALFSLGELMEKEQIRYRAGGKYTGAPIDVFLGIDARPRVSKAGFLRQLDGRSGCLLTPNEFEGVAPVCYHSLHGVSLSAGETATAHFVLENGALAEGDCIVRLHALGMLEYIERQPQVPVTILMKIGEAEQTLTHVFSNRARLPKMEEIDFVFPWSVVTAADTLSVTAVAGEKPILLHRIAIGALPITLAGELSRLPELPAKRRMHVGTETDMFTPANGDIDRLIQRMATEELGDHIAFRELSAQGAPAEWHRRWVRKLKEQGFTAITVDSTPEVSDFYSETLGENYLGEQAHEISNLAYGWGEPDPMEVRGERTLEGCKESYLKRMGPHRLVGQAIPQQHLDYEAGVELVLTETPGSHATLMLHAARGAAAAYERDMWGVHASFHVTRAPLDWDHVRRLYVFTQQTWLHGASLLQDEEVAHRYNHDTVYGYGDAIPTAYRKIYQSLYHFANRIWLGDPMVHTGFLQGNYDLLIGGAQAEPTTKRTKVWGAFGPEKDCWTFDTPEAGWKMLDSYMPNVWLYPVLQDPKDIRIFFSGAPHGQVDLLPVTAPVDKLNNYEVLYLGGWNTMTPELYDSLTEYARRGGHLILCAAQCTEHVTREFLAEKKDFAFLYDGDLSALAGVKVKMGESVIDAVCFADEEISLTPGVVRLDTQLCGATPLAVDHAGNPVLVEHRIGEGRVWTLCVGEYWGAKALDSLRECVCHHVEQQRDNSVHVTGDTAEVDWYEFAYEGGRRIVLLNTDWTSTGNIKQITVYTPGLAMPLAVQEGTTKHLLVQDEVALAFATPSAVVDRFTVDGNVLHCTVEGVGEVTLEVFTPQGRQSMLLSMGEKWSAQSVHMSLSAPLK